MNWLDKVLMWDELHMRLKAAEEAGIELAKENADLRIENAMLRQEIKGLKAGMDWVDRQMEIGRSKR
jgi:cell division protein FtsB